MVNPGKQHKNPKAQKKQNNESLRFSFRLSGRSTSITLRKNIVSLWLVLSDNDKSDYNKVIVDFIDKCIDDWKEDTASGLSAYITYRMIKSMLESDDFRSYRYVFSKLIRD